MIKSASGSWSEKEKEKKDPEKKRQDNDLTLVARYLSRGPSDLLLSVTVRTLAMALTKGDRPPRSARKRAKTRLHNGLHGPAARGAMVSGARIYASMVGVFLCDCFRFCGSIWNTG